jgi:hypothetical protein
MTTPGGRLCIHNVLTFYHAGLWQCSLRGWFYGLALGEGSGLLGSSRESFFSRCRAGFISLPGQVRRFLAQYKTGGQPSTTTQLHWLRSINLGIKCCTRSRSGVVLGQGYKYKPLVLY